MSDSTTDSVRKCSECPAVFSIKGKGQFKRTTCSPECKLARRYRLERGAKRRPEHVNRVCLECSATFAVSENSPSVTCSPECANGRKRRSAREHASRNYVKGYLRDSLPARVCAATGCSNEFKPYSERTEFCCRLCQRAERQRRVLAERQSRPRLCHKCETVDVGWGKPGKPVCDGCRVDPRANAQEKERARRFRTYGITEDEYNAMLTAQDNRCAICRRDDPGAKGWAIDHCHESDMVRGILCGRCNSAIGLLGEDPAVIANAATYVKRNLQIRLVS